MTEQEEKEEEKRHVFLGMRSTKLKRRARHCPEFKLEEEEKKKILQEFPLIGCPPPPPSFPLALIRKEEEEKTLRGKLTGPSGIPLCKTTLFTGKGKKLCPAPATSSPP